MPRKKIPIQLIPLFKGVADTFVSNPTIVFPFLMIAFIQLLALEILFFSPRFPLSVFFNPIVTTLWGERFNHYPNNFLILPKLLQYVQVPFYVLISGYLVGVATSIIGALNNGKKVSFRSACQDVLGQYIHILVATTISFMTFYGLYKLYSLLMVRALKISSMEGIFFMIKTVILQGLPYVNLLIGIFVTVIFAYVIPIIVLEKKKILSALGMNFKYLWKTFGFVSCLVLIPTLFYLPVLLVRSNVDAIAQTTFPEIRVVALTGSILVTTFIDAVIYTSLTTYYLLRSEHS
jgi:hypothetical protein